MSSSFSNQEIPPFIIHKVESIARLNRIHAPKFVNHLDILNQESLPFRTKYLKKVGSVSCPTYWLEFSKNKKSMVRRITKRFGKYCKGNEHLHPKILSSLSSLKICQYTDLSEIPLYFKLGRFPKLLLTFPFNPLEGWREIVISL